MEVKKIDEDIGESILQRYLKKMGLISRFAARKPLLTCRHRALRLVFAKKNMRTKKTLE